jgi:hypothetical protein
MKVHLFITIATFAYEHCNKRRLCPEFGKNFVSTCTLQHHLPSILEQQTIYEEARFPCIHMRGKCGRVFPTDRTEMTHPHLIKIREKHNV